MINGRDCQVASVDGQAPMFDHRFDAETVAKSNAAYIAAASPDRIIALLDALDEADSKLRGTVAMRDLAIKRGNDFADGLLVASAERDALAQQLEAMRKERDEALRGIEAIAKHVHFHIYPDGHIGMVAAEIHHDPEWRAQQEQKGGSR